MYMYIYIYIYTHSYIRTNIYSYIHTCIHACMNTYICATPSSQLAPMRTQSIVSNLYKGGLRLPPPPAPCRSFFRF